MQIVIELSDETYKDIKEENSIYGINNGLSARMTGKVVGAIQNGKPLPKGHGRLMILSEDAVKRGQTSLSFSCQKWISEVGLSNATVAIIEADKEQEE